MIGCDDHESPIPRRFSITEELDGEGITKRTSFIQSILCNLGSTRLELPKDEMVVFLESTAGSVVGTIHVQGQGPNLLESADLIRVQSYARILTNLWK